MAQVLRYPAEVGKFNKWLRFDVRKGRHVGRGQIITEKDGTDGVVMAAALYLPTSALRSGMTVGYDTAEFSGMMVEAAAEGLSEFASSKLGKDMVAGGWNGLVDAAAAIEKIGMDSGAAEVAGEWAKSKGYKLANAFLGGQLEALTGQKANPRTDIIFTAQEYRTWTFEYILIPRTLQEAQNIEKIINMFRFYMLPTYKSATTQQGAKGSYMLGYPYEWTITLYGTGKDFDSAFGPEQQTTRGKDGLIQDKREGNETVVQQFPLTVGNVIPEAGNQLKHVNRIGRSVLRNLTVDQAGAGKVAFVNDRGTKDLYPLVTSLTLEFQEVVLLGRDQRDIVGAESETDYPDPNK